MTGAVAASPLFTHPVDDAGHFPTEAITMAEATARRRKKGASGHPVLARLVVAVLRSPDAEALAAEAFQVPRVTAAAAAARALFVAYGSRSTSEPTADPRFLGPVATEGAV